MELLVPVQIYTKIVTLRIKALNEKKTLWWEKITLFCSFHWTQKTTAITDNANLLSKPDKCKAESHKSLSYVNCSLILWIILVLNAHQKSNIKGHVRNKCFTESLIGQKTHDKGPTQPFWHKLSVVRILFWTTNQRK
jgi:hypothetical protein